jgi:competence protein ComEC
MTLLYLCLSFIAGVYLGSVLHVPTEVALLVAILPAAVALLWWRQAGVRTVALCSLAVLVGLARYPAPVPPTPKDLYYYNGTGTLTVRAQVVEDPDVRDRLVYLKASASQVRLGENWQPVSGLLQVYVPLYPRYQYGDALELSGRLEEPPVFEDFSYKDYLKRQGVYSLMQRPHVTLLSSNHGNPLLVAIYALKHRAQDVIAQALPEPHAGLLMGILLGVKAALPEDLKNDLSTLGLTHIVVVSGFNLTVIAGALQRGTSKLLGRRWSMLLGLIGVVLFTLMVGASAAVVRAAIMVSLAVLATALGRQSDALTSLALAAALMVAKNPMTLWDVGFQLSVAATTGLVVLSPILESWLPTLPAVIRSPLAVAVAAQLMTVPIIAYNFHRVSLISPLANLLVLPVVPWMMLFGAIVVFVGFLAIPVASAIGWLVWLFSAYAVSVMHLLASLPFAAVPTPPLAAYWSWVYYGLLALAFYLAIRRPVSLRQPSQAAVATLRRLPTWVLIGGLLIVAVLVWAAVVLQLAAR